MSSSDKLTRVAIVSAERCKPKKCGLECKKSCPVVRMGKVCIEVKHTDKISFISEVLCIGCGICVKKCPFDAINIINLPANLEKETTHRYSANSFKLHRLPTPRPGQVLGLVGTNGIGKSTALKILAGKQKPNLGRFENPPDWQEILTYFRGSELQSFFTRILEEDIRAIIKPQYVDNIPKMVKGKVGDVLSSKNQRNQLNEIMRDMELVHISDREISQLSGGELQRFACAVTAIQDANIYMFDEPSSYLDVRQRLKTAKLIRSLLDPKSYVVVVEHDLSVLDYLSDYICCLYGQPGIYGVVTMPFSVREGINIFLDGFVPTENLRFREQSLNFKVSESVSALKDFQVQVRKYNAMTCSKGNFSITINPGTFETSEIIVLLGENGTGKTTFVKMLAGIQKPDGGAVSGLGNMSISYKPQTISPKFESTVKNLFLVKIPEAFIDPKFVTDVIKPLGVERLLDQEVKTLSGGELQRIAIVLALGKNADVYLIDEPSAYLDSEQRLTAAKVIKRFIIGNKKTAFVVEHDFIMATYMADKVIVFHGEPSIKALATKPESLLTGMNIFLQLLDITFRRDPTNYRPRINKHGSAKDAEQKKTGAYFFFEAADD